MILLLSSLAMAADCPFTATPTEIDEELNKAEAAYSALEVDAFAEAVDEASLMLPCVTGVMPTAVAARMHRIKGIVYFGAGDKALAIESLTAGKGLNKDYLFPAELLPAEHPVVTMYSDAHVAGSEEVSAPASGSLAFDGILGLDRPMLRATVAQVLGPDGKPVRTAYLHVADPMPGYELAVAATPEPPPPDPEPVADANPGPEAKPDPLPVKPVKPPKEAKDGGLPLPLVLAGSAALLYGAAGVSHAIYRSPPAPTDNEAPGWIAVNNSMVVASGALAIGAGVTWVLK